jgi:hypothetical protein
MGKEFTIGINGRGDNERVQVAPDKAEGKRSRRRDG